MARGVRATLERLRRWGALLRTCELHEKGGRRRRSCRIPANQPSVGSAHTWPSCRRACLYTKVLSGSLAIAQRTTKHWSTTRKAIGGSCAACRSASAGSMFALTGNHAGPFAALVQVPIV